MPNWGTGNLTRETITWTNVLSAMPNNSLFTGFFWTDLFPALYFPTLATNADEVIWGQVVLLKTKEIINNNQPFMAILGGALRGSFTLSMFRGLYFQYSYNTVQDKFWQTILPSSA